MSDNLLQEELLKLNSDNKKTILFYIIYYLSLHEFLTYKEKMELKQKIFNYSENECNKLLKDDNYIPEKLADILKGLLIYHQVKHRPKKKSSKNRKNEISDNNSKNEGSEKNKKKKSKNHLEKFTETYISKALSKIESV